jgi:undecaprenyl-diphosphatase
MLAWNRWLFLSLNASGHPDPVIVLTADLAAQALVFVALAVTAGFWIWGNPSRRGALLAVAVAAALALGINQVLGLFWFEPRPFMIGLGHTLLAHVPENSFPSDHATLVWALGAGLIATGASMSGGAIITSIGLMIAWARVYLGLHFPIDMATSALVAACGGVFARALRAPVERMLLPVIETVYERALQLVGVPDALFPRRH